MENNDQINYEIGILKEEMNSISNLIQKFGKENENLYMMPDFDPKDQTH